MRREAGHHTRPAVGNLYRSQERAIQPSSPSPASAEPPATFHFRYTVFSVAATLADGHLVAKSGIRTVMVPLARLQHVYVRDERRADHVELLLTHHDDKGRLKRSRLFADKHEQGFFGLVEALLALRPEADVRHLTASEAYRLSGSKEMEWIALPVVMFAGWLVLALLFSPLIRHGFDAGEARGDVASIVAGDLSSRNVIVTGRLAPTSALRGKGGEAAKIDAPQTWWIPLVPDDWQPGEVVRAVLQVRRTTAAEVEALAKIGEYRGILRDLWWEGVSKRRQTAFHARGVALAPNVVLVEFEASRKADLVLVDCPGNADILLRATIRDSDLIIAPSQPSMMDLWALEPVLEMAKKEKTPLRVLLNRVPPTGRAAQDAREVLGADLLDQHLGNRVIFQQAFAMGKAAAELQPRSKAAIEVAAVAAEIDAIN